jgi:hypothetical protein
MKVKVDSIQIWAYANGRKCGLLKSLNYHAWDVCSILYKSREDNKLVHVVEHDSTYYAADTKVSVYSTFGENLKNP